MPVILKSWIVYLLTVGTALTLSFTFLNPSASADLSFPWRLVFWAGHIFPALTLLSAMQLFLARWTILDSAHPWIQITSSGFLAAVLFAPWALFLDLAFSELAGLAQAPAFSIEELFYEFTGFVGPLMMIWIILNAPRLVQIGRDQNRAVDGLDPHQAGPETEEHSEPERDPSVAKDVFWSKVPYRLGRDLVALTAELHYLRVYTREGEALILHSFGRALEAVDLIEGVQIHRSHWIAVSHIADIVKKDGRTLCKMDTGLVLPVSRSNAKTLTQTLAQDSDG